MAVQFSNFYPCGQGMVSNANTLLETNTDMFVLNCQLFPYYSYTNRGSFDLVKQLDGVTPNRILQDPKSKEIYYTSGNSLYRYSDGVVIYENLNPDNQHDIAAFAGLVYVADGDKVVVVNTENNTVEEATYSPRKYLISNNGLSGSIGSSEVTFVVYDHGLNNNVTVSMEGFTDELGGVVINREGLNIEIINENSFKVFYPDTAAANFSGVGGSGLITARFPPVTFPKGNILEAFNNRLYISGNIEEPRRIYQSSAVLPSDPDDIVFEENTDDFLNLGIAINPTASQTFDFNASRVGFITQIQSSGIGLHIFTDTSVWWSSGNLAQGAKPVLENDTTVNPKAVCFGQGYMFFKGTNHIYKTTGDQISLEPISFENNWYVKNADNSRVRILFWDEKLFCTLGDIKNFKSKNNPAAPIADGQLQNITDLKGLALVHDLKLQKDVLWTNINAENLFAVQANTSTASEIDYTTELEFWMDGKGDVILRYNPEGSKDYNGNYPKMFLCTKKFPMSLSYFVQIKEIFSFHDKNVGDQCFYRLIGDSTDLTFSEAKRKESQSGDTVQTFSINQHKHARGIQYALINFSSTETVKWFLHRFSFEQVNQ